MRISVIIPVFDGAATLPSCLQALADSRHSPLECIVVDDGSTDHSAELARGFGAKVVSTGRQSGPAKARNLGARCATGELLVFLDSDVAVHADALGRILERFGADTDLDALIGSYDDSPADPGFISQFKNLMHAFVHGRGNRQACTFWCGCGAVKRSRYLELGGLDESYRRPSIEDIEFGFRMRDAGHKLALDPQVRCKHLKVWTFRSLLLTDVLQRGIPWTELILRTRFFPDDLNLRWDQRISVALSGGLVLLLVLEAWLIAAHGARLLMLAGTAGILACLASIFLLNRDFHRFLAARKGWRFSLNAIPMHVLYFVYSGISFVIGAGLYGFRSLLPVSSTKSLAPEVL